MWIFTFYSRTFESVSNVILFNKKKSRQVSQHKLTHFFYAEGVKRERQTQWGKTQVITYMFDRFFSLFILAFKPFKLYFNVNVFYWINRVETTISAVIKLMPLPPLPCLSLANSWPSIIFIRLEVELNLIRTRKLLFLVEKAIYGLTTISRHKLKLR